MTESSSRPRHHTLDLRYADIVHQDCRGSSVERHRIRSREGENSLPGQADVEFHHILPVERRDSILVELPSRNSDPRAPAGAGFPRNV